MKEEITIDIKEIGRRIIRRWKGIILAGIIGIILMSGIGYGLSYKKYIEGQPVDEAVLEQYKSKLTEKEQETAVQAYETYEVYKKQYQSELEYNQNSIMMKIGTENAATVELQYYINNHYQSVYPVMEQTNNALDIIAAYNLYLKSNDTIDKIKENVGVDSENKYIEELITVEAVDNTQTMKISICTDSEDLSNGIADVIEKEVESCAPELEKKYGEFDTVALNRTTSSKVDQTIFELQQTKIATVASLGAQMDTIGGSLTDAEKTYYNALVNSDEETQTAFQGKIVNKKYILLGVILGIFLFSGYIVTRYLTQKQMRNKSDLQDLYKNYTFGVITDKEDSISYITEQIIACLVTNKIQKIGVIGADQSEESQKELQLLLTELKKEKVEVIYGLGIKNTSTVIKNIGDSGCAIMLERKDGSMYMDIEKEIILCEKCNIKILGNVIIDIDE